MSTPQQLKAEIDGWHGYAATSSTKWKASPALVDSILQTAAACPDAPGWMWADLRDVFLDYSGIPLPKAKRMLQEVRVEADLGAKVFGYEQFIEQFVASRRLDLRIDERFHDRRASIQLSGTEVWNRIVVWTGDFAAWNKGEPLRAAWNVWKARNHRALLMECYERVKYNPKAPTGGLEGYVRRMCADEDPSFRMVTRAVIATHIWRVKNHLRGQLKSTVHIMPYFWGKQGSSKTRSKNLFYAPVEDAVLDADFTIFEDKAQMIDFSKMPVICFDEMAHAERADSAKIKSLMTGGTRQFRQIYQEASKMAIISTLAGYGNYPIDTVIFDASGLRRFWDIRTPNEIDLPGIKQIDMLALWQSVDEDAEEPPVYEEGVFDLLKRLQDRQRAEPPVEQFIRAIAVGQVPELDLDVWYSSSEIMLALNKWKAVNAETLRISKTRFGKEMDVLIMQRGYPIDEKVSHGTRYNFRPEMREYVAMLTGDDLGKGKKATSAEVRRLTYTVQNGR